jgi:hypothetical protein
VPCLRALTSPFPGDGGPTWEIGVSVTTAILGEIELRLASFEDYPIRQVA